MLRWFRAKDKDVQDDVLGHLIRRASVFAERGDREALVDLQRLVMRPLQSRHMLDAFFNQSHVSIDSINEWTDFGLI